MKAFSTFGLALTALLFSGPLQARDRYFIENKGQVTDQHRSPRKDIGFVLRNKGANLFVGEGQLHYQFLRVLDTAVANKDLPEGHPARREKTSAVAAYRLDVVLEGADRQAPCIMEEESGYHEYHYTHQETGTTSKAFRRLVYKNVYPHIDWVLYIKGEQVEYDFIVRPGGKVSDIRLRYTGTDALRKNKDGSITAHTPIGSVTEQRPYAYQAAGKKEVEVDFAVNGGLVTFETGAYSGTLIIDPTLEWATYYGGLDFDNATAVACDPSGNVYITGSASSLENIATSGSHQDTLLGMMFSTDAYLAKFNSAGVRQWGTYYGGNNDDFAETVTCDAAGNIIIAGNTNSSSRIATAGSHQPTFGGALLGGDGFVAKFNNAGVRQWGTYYGGDETDYCVSASCDPAGNIYIAGLSSSLIAIATAASHQDVSGGDYDGFLVKFDAGGVRQWATYYGGPTSDVGSAAVSCDPSGNVYMAGRTASTSGIATPGSHQPALNGTYDDGYLVKFNGTGVRQWATYFGGPDQDWLHSMDCDAAGNIYIAGQTLSESGIATPGSHQPVFGGGADAYLAKFNDNGALQWSTYYGGEGGDDYGDAVHCDDYGNVYLAGNASSLAGIATPGSHQEVYADGFMDAFLARFTTSGVRTWGTYYGGGDMDRGTGVASDNNGHVYLCGASYSTTQISTPGGHQPGQAGGEDAFLAKFNNCFPDAVILAAHTVFCPGDSLLLRAQHASGYTYQWQYEGVDIPGATDTTLLAGQSGTYTLLVSCADAPVPDTAHIRITQVSFSAAIGFGDTALCISALPFQVPATATAPDSFALGYTWTPAAGLDDPAILNPWFSNGPGTYTLVLEMTSTAPIACVSRDTATIIVHPAPVLTNVTPDTTIFYGSSVQLNAGGAASYTWTPATWLNNPSIYNPVSTPEESITYTVIGTSEFGCADTASVRINIDYTIRDFIPSAFSPNGDGRNDLFHVVGYKYQRVEEFRVFNRWGQLVFTAMDNKGWDGTVKGKPAEAGAYYYIITLRYPDGKSKTFKGDVTLVR